MDQDKLVSVVIPVFRSAEFIGESIYSIVNQSYKNLEIIVIDDTPDDDGTKGILDSFHDKRIIYIKPEKRLGMVKSLNYAIALSKGNYIARMDADDISHKERIKLQVEYLERNENVGIVGCNCYTMNKKNKITGTIIHPANDDDIKSKMLFNVALIHPSIMARKQLLIDAPYNEGCYCCEDYELWSRLIFKTNFHNLKQCLFKYRILSGSAMQKQLQRIKEDNEYYQKHTAILKIAYDNVLHYHDAGKMDLPSNYVDMLFAKKIDSIPIKEREEFLKLCVKILRTRNNNKYVDQCIGYQWLKMTKTQFWKATESKIKFASIVQIISAFGWRLKIVLNRRGIESSLYDWKI